LPAGAGARPRLLSIHLALTIAMAVPIAVLVPFDLGFTALSLGSPALRGLIIGLITVAGTAFAGRLGLRLDGHGSRRPLLVGLAAAAVVAAYVTLLDAFVFRSLLLPSYIEVFQQPLSVRLAYFMLRAFDENIIYRLFVFTGLTLVATMLAGRRPPPFRLAFAMMVAAQVLNIGVNVVIASGEPWTPALLTYDALRYVAPGVLWGCLFWRFGFTVAEVASVGCHVFLQPALGLLLA
jgi:hypothetical protein